MINKFIAICPKCEIFYKLQGYYPNFYCAHSKSISLRGMNKRWENAKKYMYECPIEAIECKIMEEINGVRSTKY